jgi:hypothetical protein
MELGIDDTWLKTAEEEDTPYDEFYPEEVDVIQIFFMYVNKDNNLISMKNDRLLINNGMLNKIDLSILLKNNKKLNGLYFEPMSILKYNIDLSPNEVKHFVEFSRDFKFLTCEKNIQNLKWNESIPLFKDINSLHILYYQVDKNFKRRLTKRIKLKNNRKTRKK